MEKRNSLNLKTASLAALFFVVGCSKASSPQPVQVTSDFYISAAPKNFKSSKSPLSAGPISREQCQKNLEQAVCVTTLDSGSIQSDWSSVKCTKNVGPEYVQILMAIFDETPELMRRSLCSLEKIFLSDKIQSTAFASSIVDDNGRMVGGYVGFRKQTFLKQPTSKEIITWKEQLAFGGSQEFLSNDPKLVQMNYNLKLDFLKSDGLFYVLMHELGHLIDFNNGITMSFASAWQDLSWSDHGVPLAASEYLMQNDFCYYNCSSFIPASKALSIYESLAKSAFVTSYSGTNATEDFAEFWAWHLALNYKSADFHVVVPGQGEIDLTEKWKSNDKISAKFQFVHQLWQNPTLAVDNRAKHAK